jgi:lysophospholipase L1-like esterase
MKKLATILLGTLVAACALHAGGGSKTRLVQNLEAGKKQTLVTFGTSLTAVGAWVDQLRVVLDQQFPGQATVINGAQGGANSDWGCGAIDEKVLAHKPDTVLIEFSVNDAVAKRKTSVDHARENLENMIDRVLAANPDCEIILQLMNPPIGHTKTARPNLAAYGQMYHDVAAARGFRLIDHGPAWQDLLKTDPRTFLLCSPDTIHPLRSGSLKVSTPVVLAALGLAPGNLSASTEAPCDKYIHHLMDKGQDRTVSRTEFDAFWIEQYKLNDTDSNGNVAAAELHSPELHAALDANRDGNLDQPEYVAFFSPLFESNPLEVSSPTKR